MTIPKKAIELTKQNHMLAITQDGFDLKILNRPNDS